MTGTLSLGETSDEFLEEDTVEVQVRASEDGTVIFRAMGDVFTVALNERALGAVESALREALISIERFRELVPSTDRTSHPSSS